MLKSRLLPIFVALGAVGAVLIADGAPQDAHPSGTETDLPAPPTDCAGGCSAAPPLAEGLGPDRLSTLWRVLSSQSAGTPSPELDEILFSGAEAAAHLDQTAPSLSSEWIRFLNKELGRRYVRVRVWVTGEDGAARIRVDRDVALGHRTHVAPEFTRGLTPPEVTLTVRRVGLDHLWTRL